MQNEVVTQMYQPEHKEQTTCCIVGSGPAGAVLALLLARKGIPVVLLEEHMNFDRDFRGDTIHPSVMQIMDEIGLADRLLEIPHSKIYNLSVQTANGNLELANLRRLKTRFPYIAMIPQVRFLEFITQEAKRYPNFRLVLGARVEKLIKEDGYIHGVQYRGQDGWHEVRALLTVAADGRFSRVRRLAGFEPHQTAQSMDVLWFRLPVQAGDSTDSGGRVGNGHVLVLLNRADFWQVAYVIVKGGYQKLRAAGLPAFRQELAQVLPEWADRLETLQEWKQISVLSVESSRLPRWYCPGLLLIGDAAHVMSPIGGVGINYAIQDAVVAANVLTDPLTTGRLHINDLAEIQRRRVWPTRIIQAFQNTLQKQIFANVLSSDKPVTFSPVLRLLLRTPVVRNLPARFIAFGPVAVHVSSANRTSPVAVHVSSS
jgi:2-polyprenyl-6-methoxyphenol hydroxylase-like FAD-dependent oxidoreductase